MHCFELLHPGCALFTGLEGVSAGRLTVLYTLELVLTVTAPILSGTAMSGPCHCCVADYRNGKGHRLYAVSALGNHAMLVICSSFILSIYQLTETKPGGTGKTLVQKATKQCPLQDVVFGIRRGHMKDTPEGCNEMVSVLIRYKADADIAHC